jgi:membrane protein
LDRWQPPGFEGSSLFTVGKTMLREIRVHRLNVRAAAVTYNFIMAIPPSLLFFCSLVPYLPLHGVQDSILTLLRIVTPNETSYRSISSMIIDFLHHERRDILSFGILTTFFFSSNGIMGLMRSFDRAFPMYVKRNGLKRRWTAIKLTAMVLVVVILAIAALIVQTDYLNEFLASVFGFVYLVQLLTLLIVVAMIFLVICVVYTYGPSLTQRFRFVSPGAILATFLCVLISFVFFFLVKNVLHYNKIYGSIGTLMALMVWIFLITQVLLIGYELNVSILLSKLARNPAPVQKAELPPHQTGLG